VQPREGGSIGARPVRPARFWYWVAGAAGVAAVVWFALGLFLGFRSLGERVEGFQRVPIPGRAEVGFAEPGGYTLYFEGLGAADEQATIPSFDVSLTSVDGQEVPIRPYSGSATYGIAGHSGRAVGTFRIEEPGNFLLQTDGEPQGVEASLAVGPGIGPTVARAVLVPIAGAMVLFLAGAILAVVVAVRRSRAGRPPPAPAAPAMTTVGQATGPPGWFPDPGRRHELRYWDGHRWTEHVSDRGTQRVDPV
jgi:hypothetical protein